MDQLAQDVDLAVVAVGGADGDALARQCLRRGIDVLQEHPVRPRALARTLAVASEAGRSLHVNAHFPDLAAARSFVARVKRRCRRGPPRYAIAIANRRSLYSALDILGRCFGAAEVRVSGAPPGGGDQPFASMAFTMGGLAVALLCQTTIGRVDDGSDILIDHRIVVGFEDGDLMLGSCFGPVVQSPIASAALGAAKWGLVPPVEPVRRQEVWPSRTEANRRAVLELRRQVLGAPPVPHQEPAYLRALSRAWWRIRSQIVAAAGEVGAARTRRPRAR